MIIKRNTPKTTQENIKNIVIKMIKPEIKN